MAGTLCVSCACLEQRAPACSQAGPFIPEVHRNSFSGSHASITRTFSMTSRASLMGFSTQRTADTAPADRSLPSMMLASISTSPFTFRTDPQPKPRRSWKARVKNWRKTSDFPLTYLFQLTFGPVLEEHHENWLGTTGLETVCLPEVPRTGALR